MLFYVILSCVCVCVCVQGTVCRDLCACMFCPCCVLAQMYREINNTMEQ